MKYNLDTKGVGCEKVDGWEQSVGCKRGVGCEKGCKKESGCDWMRLVVNNLKPS